MKASTFMQIAFLVSQESKCCSCKVGAVIVKDNRIISQGYNGTPYSHENCCDVATQKGWTVDGKFVNKQSRVEHSSWSKENEVHAEMNAIMNARDSLIGSTLYTTISPCTECAKHIAQVGIRTVVYCINYDNTSKGWSDLLRKSGVSVHQLGIANMKYVDFQSLKILPEFLDSPSLLCE